MSSHTEDEWTILNPTILSQANMEAVVSEVPNTAEMLDRESTVDAKPATTTPKPREDCTCEAKPVLARKESIESIDEDNRRPRRVRSIPSPPPCRYTPSPNRYCPPPPPFVDPNSIRSSTQLLERVGKEDGIVEFPTLGLRSVYLATYPFGNKDVQKWSWLFAAGIEGEYLVQSPRDVLGGLPMVERIRPRSDGLTPHYGNDKYAIPPVYLSRALDTQIVPEHSEHSVRYLIVTENHPRAEGVQLMVAESRKAAGMLIYYAALNGDPVLFVGATAHQCKTVHANRYKKVHTLDEAVTLQHDGFAGIVC